MLVVLVKQLLILEDDGFAIQRYTFLFFWSRTRSTMLISMRFVAAPKFLYELFVDFIGDFSCIQGATYHRLIRHIVKAKGLFCPGNRAIQRYLTTVALMARKLLAIDLILMYSEDLHESLLLWTRVVVSGRILA